MNNITVSMELITPNSAQEYLKLNTHNRRVSFETVNFYAKQMTEGNWQISPEGISFDKYGNLIDGQHRLMAIIKSNLNINFLVSRGFDRDVFTVINTGKNRSAADTLSISNVKNASRVSATIKKVESIKKEHKSNKGSFKNLKLSNTDVLNYYNENSLLIDDIMRFSNNLYKKSKLMLISDIAGTILYLMLFKKHNEKAYEFFTQLFFSSDCIAINLLRDKLILAKSNNIDKAVLNVYIIKAWNSFIIGTEVKSLRYFDNEIVTFK